ncbi:NB-ARC domain-containing protein [Lentzea sp. BCCO 10_0061]|uniref:NB-ARC domain-containing protein n=1 Tax=Lentzea sokolovensis TaxID=3095429 RepID=A0ABU4UUL0_9PSEU|nr:BTAD domain-containing putative transcriptional regulator [Lentzea sp. BCCO 10_0061]MDX8143136.1 NB-ARC domain-containing protein [Lentzea sp. BCCO 10_0061]
MTARFTILGQTGIRVGDAIDTQWGSLKLRAMLGALLAQPRVSVPAAELADWVWSDGGDLPLNPVQTLYSYSYRIRRALDSMQDRVELVVANGAYRLDVDRKSVDYFQFRDHLDRARALVRRGDHQQALDVIRGAFGIWRHQRPLEDLRSSRADAWRHRFRLNVLLPAYDLLCGEYLVLGDYAEVLEVLEDLDHHEHPVLLKRRLEALYRLARVEEATELFFSAYKAYKADVNDAAADDLREFHDQLKENGVAGSRPREGTAGVLVPEQLPLDVPMFVGHKEKFAELDAVAANPGVVIIDGVGGVGKTAFAVRWCHTRRQNFPGGVLFADLQGFSDGAIVDASSVVDRFLQGLGVPPDRIANPDHRTAKLQSVLSGRKVAVVLDNARNAAQIHSLLPLFSSCVVIVTSRSRMSGLAARFAPQRISIGPLGLGDASELLADRIGERARGCGALGELTRVCQGLPIVLKVLANHIAQRPAVPLNEFVKHFHERGVLDLDATHGPRAVFMQSLRALEPEARVLFRTIGAHPGPSITVGVAAAMTGLPKRRVHEALDALTEAHLLDQAGELDRFKLHDLLREFSAGLLDDAEQRGAIELRMLDHYLRTAERADQLMLPTMVRVPTPDDEQDAGALEFENVTSARRWCEAEAQNLLALVRLAFHTGYYEHAATIPQLVGQILLRKGNTAEVLNLLHTGLAAAKFLGACAEEETSALLLQIGYTYLLRQEYRRAEHHVHLAHLGFARAEGDQTVAIASCLHTGARILVETGSVIMGIDSHERALLMLRQSDHPAPSMEIGFLYRAGEAYKNAFEYARAATYYHQALALACEIGDETSEATVLHLLGALSFARERTAEAREFAEAALFKHARLHAIGNAGEACALLSEIELEDGRLFDAKQYARQAIRLCGRAGASLHEATALHVLSRILEREAQFDGAVEALERAHVIFADLDRGRAELVAAELRELQVELALPAARSESPVLDLDR